MIERVCSGRFLEAEILKVGERGTKLTEGRTLAHPVCVRLMFNLLYRRGKKERKKRIKEKICVFLGLGWGPYGALGLLVTLSGSKSKRRSP